MAGVRRLTACLPLFLNGFMCILFFCSKNGPVCHYYPLLEQIRFVSCPKSLKNSTFYMVFFVFIRPIGTGIA